VARRFPLEAVLRLRRMQEEAKMKEFASFEGVRVRELHRLRSLQGKLDQAQSEMTDQATREGIPSQRAQVYLAFFGAQGVRIRYQHDLLRKVEAEVRRRRREMALAITRRKIFERLKERHLEEEERDQRWREAIELDDTAGIRFAARARGRNAKGA